jgi:hypothetical protein
MAVITCWLLAFTDPNAKQQVGEVVPFTSPDLMKNLPKVMSNMLGKGAGGEYLGY